MLLYVWISHNIMLSEKSRRKRVYTVQFFLHKVLELAKLICTDSNHINGSLRQGDGVNCKRAQSNLLSGGHVVSLERRGGSKDT